tara:strand:- start:4712 stop:12814 length:8103 start_codon:yes stop_codon:yes gene_type:complete
MSGGYDRYDLHREVDLSKVERIIYVNDSSTAGIIKAAFETYPYSATRQEWDQWYANTSSIANNAIGSRVSANSFENAIVLEKRHFLDDGVTPAGHMYSHPSIPGGSELHLDGQKIWPFYGPDPTPTTYARAYCTQFLQREQGWGYSIALSDESESIDKLLAVGAPGNLPGGTAGAYTFDFDASSWGGKRGALDLEPVGYGGLQFAGFSPGDNAGSSVDVNYDGTVVAVGSDQHSRHYCKTQSGYVYVKHLVNQEIEWFETVRVRRPFGWRRTKKRFTRTEKKWLRKGQIIGGDPYDRAGYKVKLSQDGNTLAVSCTHHHQQVCHLDEVGDFSPKNFHKGSVKVYSYDAASDRWIQKGSTLTGAENWEAFGVGLDMTPDGNCIVVGSPYSSCPWGARIGRVQVFKYDGSDWKRVGEAMGPSQGWAQEDIDAFQSQKSYYTNSKWGESVAINGDGTTVIIGAPQAKSGAFAVTVWKWSNSDGWARTDALLQRERFGSNVSVNDAGTVMAVSDPWQDYSVKIEGSYTTLDGWQYENVEKAGDVRVYSINSDGSITGNDWLVGYNNYISFTGVGSFGYVSKVALSPSGNYIAMGSHLMRDRSTDAFDEADGSSSGHRGGVKVCDITELVEARNVSTAIGQQSHSFSDLRTLGNTITEHEALCVPGGGGGGGSDDEPEGPNEEEPGSDSETYDEQSDPEPENPTRGPPGSPLQGTGEPPIALTKEPDGTIVKKQVHITEEKKVVYVTEYIDPENCNCTISSGKKNNTTVTKPYVPPDDGVLIERDGTTRPLYKNQSVDIPPGGTVYVRKPPGAKRVIGYTCPFVEDWHPLTHIDCKYLDPNYTHPNYWDGKMDEPITFGGGNTYNNSKSTITRTATKRGYVTKDKVPPDGTIRQEWFDVGDTVTAEPGEYIFEEGGGDDDAEYEGGAYMTEDGSIVNPSDVLDEHDSGIVNNTTEVVTIQKQLTCEEYCACLKIGRDGTVEELDIRETGVELGPGETLIRGRKKDTLPSSGEQTDAGYEGGTYTNADGHEVDPRTLVWLDSNIDPGTVVIPSPFLSSPGRGTVNKTKYDTEYHLKNNAFVQKKNGDIERYEVGEGGSGGVDSPYGTVTLNPGDAIFEDLLPPSDRSKFNISVGDMGDDPFLQDLKLLKLLNNLTGGGEERRGIQNNTSNNSTTTVPDGHKGIRRTATGETSVFDSGASVTLGPGDEFFLGSANGTDGTGWNGTGSLENEEDVGNIPLDDLLSNGQPGFKNNKSTDLEVEVPEGKIATLVGPNNEIKIVGPGDVTVPSGWTINTGDSTGVEDGGYQSGQEKDGNVISDLIDDPDSGITNNTSKDICVPAVTKEIEDDDGQKTQLLNKNNGSLSLATSRTNMLSLMRMYNISPVFTNPAGIFSKPNPYTTIAETKAPDDCEAGYVKLKPGETMYRGKSNGVEDAEYTGGSLKDPNTGQTLNTTDVGSLVSNSTSGLTNSSGVDKSLNLPQGWTGAILDTGRRLRLLNGAANKKITLKNGESLIMGEAAGVTDAEYSGSGNLNGSGTNIGTFVNSPSSGIKNTSGSDKTIQLGTGNTGIIINDSTGEIGVVNSGGNAVIKSGWSLYEGGDAGIKNAGVTNPEVPYNQIKLSDAFTDNASIREGVKNTSGSAKTIKVPPANTNAFLFKPNGSFEVIRGYAGGGSPETMTLEDGESLIIGGALEGVKVSTDNLAHGGFSTFYVPSTNWGERGMGEGDTITDGRIGGEFTLNSVNTDFGYKLDTITVNGQPSGNTITIDSTEDITIGAIITQKAAYNVTLAGNSSADSGGITFTWPNGQYTDGSFSPNAGSASSAGGFSSGTFMEGTVLTYTVTPESNYEMSSLEIGGEVVTALTGQITVNQNTSVSLQFANKTSGITVRKGNIGCSVQWRIFEESTWPTSWPGIAYSTYIAGHDRQYIDLPKTRDYGFKAGLAESGVVNDGAQAQLPVGHTYNLFIDSVVQRVRKGGQYSNQEAWVEDGWEIQVNQSTWQRVLLPNIDTPREYAGVYFERKDDENGNRIQITIPASGTAMIRPRWKLKTYEVTIPKYVVPDIEATSVESALYGLFSSGRVIPGGAGTSTMGKMGYPVAISLQRYRRVQTVPDESVITPDFRERDGSNPSLNELIADNYSDTGFSAYTIKETPAIIQDSDDQVTYRLKIGDFYGIQIAAAPGINNSVNSYHGTHNHQEDGQSFSGSQFQKDWFERPDKVEYLGKTMFDDGNATWWTQLRGTIMARQKSPRFGSVWRHDLNIPNVDDVHIMSLENPDNIIENQRLKNKYYYLNVSNLLQSSGIYSSQDRETYIKGSIVGNAQCAVARLGTDNLPLGGDFNEEVIPMTFPTHGNTPYGHIHFERMLGGDVNMTPEDLVYAPMWVSPPVISQRKRLVKPTGTPSTDSYLNSSGWDDSFLNYQYDSSYVASGNSSSPLQGDDFYYAETMEDLWNTHSSKNSFEQRIEAELRVNKKILIGVNQGYVAVKYGNLINAQITYAGGANGSLSTIVHNGSRYAIYEPSKLFNKVDGSTNITSYFYQYNGEDSPELILERGTMQNYTLDSIVIMDSGYNPPHLDKLYLCSDGVPGDQFSNFSVMPAYSSSYGGVMSASSRRRFANGWAQGNWEYNGSYNYFSARYRVGIRPGISFDIQPVITIPTNLWENGNYPSDFRNDFKSVILEGADQIQSISDGLTSTSVTLKPDATGVIKIKLTEK